MKVAADGACDPAASRRDHAANKTTDLNGRGMGIYSSAPTSWIVVLDDIQQGTDFTIGTTGDIVSLEFFGQMRTLESFRNV